MNGDIGHGTAGAGRRVEGARRVVLLLLTIGALLFVGMQSRVAQSLPTRDSQQLLTSFSDPVKFPPPEERASVAAAWFAMVPAGPVVALPLHRPLGETPAAVSYIGERHAEVHLLRAPPASL